MHRLNLIFAAAAAVGLATPGVAQRETSEALCLDARIRHAAAEVLGTWSQNFAFAKVIIGNDGKFGSVSVPKVKSQGPGYVVCHASYTLSKAGPSGNGYVVAIPDFDFRVTTEGDIYNVTLENLPDQTDGSDEQTNALLARFTINDRPYRETLDANRARLRERGN